MKKRPFFRFFFKGVKPKKQQQLVQDLLSNESCEKRDTHLSEPYLYLPFNHFLLASLHESSSAPLQVTPKQTWLPVEAWIHLLYTFIKISCLFVLKTWIFFFLFNDRHLYVKCVPCMTFKHQELQHGWFSSFIHFYCTLYTYDKDVVCKVLLSCSYCSCRCMVLHDISEEKLKWSFDENCLIFLCKTLGVCMCCLFQICLWRPSKIPSVMIDSSLVSSILYNCTQCSVSVIISLESILLLSP